MNAAATSATGRVAARMTAPRIICVGTHHKTGTLWMRWVFRKLAGELGLPFLTGTGLRALGDLPEDRRAVLCNWSSKFSARLLDRDDVRVLHMIRDPRDVLLSGMAFHRRAGPEHEAFLHRPRADLGGRTYQEHLNALPDISARLLFEMRETHAQTLAQMLAWDYGRDNSAEATYEVLIRDFRGHVFSEILHFLGFSRSEVRLGTEIFLKHSLFGDMQHALENPRQFDVHIASGLPARWKTELPRDVAEVYAAEYGPALVTLGYETHPTAWLAEIADDG